MSYVFPNRPPEQLCPYVDTVVFFEPKDDMTAKELLAAMRLGFGGNIYGGWFPESLQCRGKDFESCRQVIADAGAERHFRWECAL